MWGVTEARATWLEFTCAIYVSSIAITFMVKSSGSTIGLRLL